MSSGVRFLPIFGLAVILMGACATSDPPTNDGVITGGSGGDAGDEGNPYGGGADADTEGGTDPNDAGAGEDTSVAETSTPADSGATDTGPVMTAGVCAKTSTQEGEFAILFAAGGGTDCSASPSTACDTASSGECCYVSSTFGDLCVPE